MRPTWTVFWSLIVLLNAIPFSLATAQDDPEEALRSAAARQTTAIQQGGRQWPVFETEFFSIHHQANEVPDPAACQELDSFVIRTLGSFDPNGNTLQALRNDKLEYYLCDDLMVEKLTGYPTKGMADLRGRAVISSHFPHFHELAHSLVYLLMEEKPSQTHPLVQEGLACLIGGRWGRAPQTILYTGWVHHNFGMGELGEVMTPNEFHSHHGGADVAYALGTVFCETIRRQVGDSGVLELNRRLSGTAEFVSTLSAENVMEIVAEICDWDHDSAGPELEKVLSSLWPELKRCGISPAETAPSGPPTQEFSGLNNRVKIWQGESHQTIWVKSKSLPVFLLSPAGKNPQAQSSLFKDHFPGEDYFGQRYGLRCGLDNIALYDYAANQLIATWVAGFTDEVEGCGNLQTGLIFEINFDALNAMSEVDFEWDIIVRNSP